MEICSNFLKLVDIKVTSLVLENMYILFSKKNNKIDLKCCRELKINLKMYFTLY